MMNYLSMLNIHFLEMCDIYMSHISLNLRRRSMDLSS